MVSACERLLIMPAPPIIHGGLVVNDRSLLAMLFATASDEQAVHSKDYQRHPNSHIKYHFPILLFLFISEGRGEMFLSTLGFASCNAVNGVDH